MPQDQQVEFKDPTVLKKWTVWFLYAQVIIAVIAIGSGALEYQLLSDYKNGAYTSQAQAKADGEINDLRQVFVAIIQILVMVVSGFLILRWIYRSNYNAHRLGAEGMAFTPGWSIGWYFIPIANLWKPYQAMKEIWLASSSPQNWTSQSASPLLPWWWFLWIVSNFASNIAFRMTMRANDVDDFIDANLALQASDIASIPLSLIMIAIVNAIHRMQMTQRVALYF